MTELIRDTVFGHFLRKVTGNKVLLYEEEKDPSLWKKYVHVEKSANVAKHGQTTPPEDEKEDKQDNEKDDSNSDDNDNQRPHKRSRTGSQSSASTAVQEDAPVHELSGTKIDQEKGKDVNIVDWWGPEDTENPKNWSRGKRFFVTFEICLLTLSVYIGSAIYSPGIKLVMAEYNVSQVAATLGLSLFVLGYALGPMIWAPMSEVPQIGRNPVYIGTLFVFVLFQFPIIYATNFGMMLAFRFLTGFIGSPALATGGASIGDMYSPAKRTYGIAVWGIAAVSGPTLGPLVGGFAAEAKGWRWTIWELLWLSAFSFVLFIFFLPETSSENILYRRARRLRKITGNENLITEGELASKEMKPKDIVMMSLVKPFTLSLTEPICLALNMYIALVYGLLYIWFESFPLVFTGMYGWSLGIEGLAFLGILIGTFVVLPPFVWYFHKYTEPQFNEDGELTPELRLPPAFVGAFALPICLFWFGWSAGRTHWIVPIIGSGLFSVGTFTLFNAVLNYLSDVYPTQAASVLAGNDFFRSMFGAGFPLFANAMFSYLGVDWASSTLAFLSIAFIPIPFVLHKYGKQIRLRSKNARHDL